MKVIDLRILPCPFCGRDPYVETSGEGGRGLMIHCTTPSCANPSVSYYSHASALATWNGRWQPAELSARPTPAAEGG